MAKDTTTEAPKLITVKATANINEDGVHYKPDETFETTPERAAALGDLVTTAG